MSFNINLERTQENFDDDDVYEGGSLIAKPRPRSPSNKSTGSNGSGSKKRRST